jgi:hypothetical protein
VRKGSRRQKVNGHSQKSEKEWRKFGKGRYVHLFSEGKPGADEKVEYRRSIYLDVKFKLREWFSRGTGIFAFFNDRRAMDLTVRYHCFSIHCINYSPNSQLRPSSLISM